MPGQNMTSFTDRIGTHLYKQYRWSHLKIMGIAQKEKIGNKKNLSACKAPVRGLDDHRGKTSCIYRLTPLRKTV